MPPRRSRSPHAEKQLDYRKQRRGFSEYAQALRHGKWRSTKRRPAQQVERQAARLALSHDRPDLRDPGFDPGAIARPRIAKWSTSTLGDWVERRRKRRR